MSDLDQDSIEVQGLPELMALPNGRWRRELRLTFERELPANLVPLSSDISEKVRSFIADLIGYKYPHADYQIEADDFILSLKPVDARTVVVVTESGRYSRTGEFWLIAPAYLLVCIARGLGEIVTIEGRDKDEYWLWRNRGSLLGDRS